MADSEMLFDPSMKKKKKSKKKPNFEMDDEGEAPATEELPKAEPEEKTEESAPSKHDDIVDLDDFDFSKIKKKPKKKQKKFDLGDVKDALDEAEKEGTESAPAEDVAVTEETTEIKDDLDFDFSKEKKKKKKKAKLDDIMLEKAGNEDDGSNETWADTDRDYTYDELLTRVFDIMREKNPEMLAGEKKRLIMKPPQVMRVGTRKTSFSNFPDICRMLHRQPKHLLAFLLAELGTSGSVDGNNQLIIKGRFQSKQIENVLRRYIREYVTCHTCRSPDTILQKDTRLFFLQCETCGSRCSVASIKSGFQAVTGKRAALRAKTA